jgi:hypothetical protein
VQILNVEEQKLVSEDQKHSSNVARVHYQKLRSRDVAIKGKTCMEKLRGLHGAEMDTCVRQLKQEHCSDHESKSDNEITPMPQRTTVKVSAEKRKPLRFTKGEDEFIERGIKSLVDDGAQCSEIQNITSNLVEKLGPLDFVQFNKNLSSVFHCTL